MRAFCRGELPPLLGLPLRCRLPLGGGLLGLLRLLALCHG
jgi:hypothetical protein